MNIISSSRPRARSIVVAHWVVMVLSTLLAKEAAAATSGYTITSPSSVRFHVNDAPWADLHYQVNGGIQLNVRMNPSGNNHTYDVSGVPSGATVRYFFTIGNFNGGAIDTVWTELTMSGGGGGGGDGNWAVVWEDLFNGNGQPDPAHWNYHVGNGWNPGLGAFQGWGNGEWEWYRPENAYMQGGNLVIRADFHSTPTVIAGRNWYQRSARITTKGKRSWQYGRIEARIAMPNAIGAWPAFWMMGTACDDTVTSNHAAPIGAYDVMASNWSSCGEIDIMEHRNSEAVTFQNLFWDTRAGLFPWGNGLNAEQPHSANAGNVAQFHLYTIEWEPTQIRWYIDRETNPTPVHTVNITASNMEEFHRPFHIILNLALGGLFTGFAEPNPNDFPLFMYVDYVRVWQRQ
jgi:beta-glucanase (GH16 family)